MKVIVVDNYDSFTYNLVHVVEKILHQKIDVVKNDEWNIEQFALYDKIILSPGPGIPEKAGILIPLIQQYASSKSILGVCLGHQAIAQAFGATLINLDDVYHGIATPIKIQNSKFKIQNNIFTSLPAKIQVGRYHSWIVSKENFPAKLEITAIDDNGYIMALQHQNFDVTGVQFHPESILTPDGESIIKNWLYYQTTSEHL